VSAIAAAAAVMVLLLLLLLGDRLAGCAHAAEVLHLLLVACWCLSMQLVASSLLSCQLLCALWLLQECCCC
jgi:hypothetical protein